MLKKLKKVVAGSGERKNSKKKKFLKLSTSDTSSGDDSFHVPPLSAPTNLQLDVKSDALLNEAILNLGGDLGLMSLSPELHCEDSTTAFDNTTALSLYTTAYENSEKNIVGEEAKEIMDDSFNSTRDDLCLTALEDSFGDSDVPKDLPVSQQHDDLDDCIAAFDGLAIVSKPSPKKQDTLDIPGKTALNDKNLFNGDLYRRLSDGSSFCVIDWDADGQPVEHTLRYLPKLDSTNKASTSLLSNIEKDSQAANNDYVAVNSAKGDDHFVQTTVIPHNEDENISKSQEVSSAQSSEIQLSSSSLQSVSKPAGESTNLPNSLPESSAIAIPHSEPVEPSTSDSNTASNSESYVNALSLPNIGSAATSRDSTPFLTPEADMSFSDFDPLAKEIRTPVKDIALSAGICKEVEGDIDTNTSSDTLTANDVRSDASSFALLNDSPTEPGVKADSLHQSTSDVTQHILSTTAHSHNSPDTKAAVSHQALLENTSDTSSHTLSKTECLEPKTSDLSHAAAKVPSPIVPADCASSSKAESEIGAGDYSANSLLDESISDHSKLDSQEHESKAALKFSTKIVQSDVGDHKTPVVLAANQADELAAMFSEISLGKSSSSEHVIEETIPSSNVNQPDMDLHETSADLGTRQLPNQAVNVIEGQCGECKSDMSSNLGHESNEVDLHCFDSVKSAPGQDITKKEVSSVVDCVKSLSDFTETEYGSVKKDLAIHGKDLIESSEQSADINNALEEAEIPLSKGAYTLDFSQMDDPNFDPFKTSTGINNSPTKTTRPDPEIPSLQSEVSYPSTVLQEKQNLSFEKAKVESVKNKPHKTKSLKAQVKHTGDVISHTADLPDDAQDLLIPKISFDSKSFHSSDSNLLMSSEDHHIPATVKSTVAGQTPDSSFTLNLEIDGVSNDVSCTESERKITVPQIPNNKEQVLCSEMVEQPSSLGSISVKVSSVSESETVVSSIDALVSDAICNGQLDQAKDVQAGHAGDFKPDVAKSLATESSIFNVADDGDSTEDAIPAHGAYSFDFSKFDDPNYDPFKTSHGLSNSPTEEIPKARTDLVQPDLGQKDNTPSLSQDQSAKSVSKPKTSESKLPCKKSAKKAKPVVDSTISNKEADSENISVPQGAYTMDFSQFDDPNFNPFTTSSGVANSPTGVSPPSNAFSFASGNEKLSNIGDECLEEAPISGQSFKEDESCLVSKQPVTTPSIPAKHDQNLDDTCNPQMPYSVDLKQSDDLESDEFNSTKDTPSTEENNQEKLVIFEPPVESCNQDAVKVIDEPLTETDLSVERNAPGKPNKQSTSSQSSAMKEMAEEEKDDHPPPGAYSFDFSKFDDPNYDPFKTSHGLSNSPTEEIPKARTDLVQPDLGQKDNTPSLSLDQSAKSVSKPKTSESKKLLKKSTKKAKPVVDSTISNKEADSEVISVPQGAYTMDFSQFDDPNFNPFTTSSGVANSPTGVSPSSNAFSFASGNEKLSNIGDECLEEAPISGQSFKEDESCLVSKQPVTTPSIPAKHDQNLDDTCNPQTPYSVDLKQSDDSAFDEKNLSVERNAPGKPNKQSQSHQRAATKEMTEEEEERPPSGAYSFDFSKFDDPNFDPFKTSKGVSNSPTKETREQMLPPVENDAPSEKQISVEVTDKSSTSLPKSKKVFTPKKRSKKPKPWQTIDNDNTGNAENLPVQPGSYSIDFSELDDVNFDPFKTTKAVMNSPTKETSDNSFTVETKTEELLPEENTQRAAAKTVKVEKRSEKPKPWQSATGEDKAEGSSDIPHQAGTYSIDFSKLDGASDDPFKTTNKISNSPTGELVATLTSQTKSNFSSENQDDDTAALPEPSRLVDSESEEITSAVTPGQTDTSTNDDQVENLDDVQLKPGAYSIDFSNFDDPNFDPFKTSKGLSNSPTKETPPSLDNNDNTEKMPSIPAKKKVQKSSQGSKLKKPGLSKKKAKKPVPVETLDIRAGDDEDNSDSLAKPGAYSLDFSQFSDPSCDPFESNSGLNNSPTKVQPDSITGEAAAIDITTADTVLEKSVSVPSPKKSKSSKSKIAKKPKTPPSSLQDTDEDAATRGAYSIDFSKFDDPNYNPFASTSGGLSNSPTRETVAAIAQAPVEKMPSHAQDASSVEKIEANSVLVSKDNSVDTPSAAKPGAGVTDFSKFDDPNFDPFKPNKGLSSSPVDKQFPPIPSSNATSSDDSDAYFDAASHNSSLGSKSAASDIRANELDETLRKTTTQVPENENPNDTFTVGKDVFKSAEEVFGSEAGQSQWDKFWKDEAKGTDIPLDSALRKQSLYVQFDPLLETTRLPEYSHTSRPPAVAVNNETQLTKDVFDFLDHGEPPQVTSDHPSHPQTKKVMTSYEQPQLHPAAARLARNLSDDGRKWNETEAQDGSIGIDLINFSPSSKMRNRTTYSTVKSEVQSGGHRYTQEELDEMAAHDRRVLEQEVTKLRRLRDKLKQDYEERKLEIMWYKESEADMREKLSEVQSSVEMAKLENERVRGEFLSTKRVFDDYHRRTSDLRPVLESHLKADAELRKQYNIRLTVNQTAMQEYLSLKNEAETAEANLEAQLEQARTAANNRRRALEARVKKEQMTVASMDALLKDKIKENEELSKICDELVANAENS